MNQDTTSKEPQYAVRCGCGKKLIVADATKREQIRTHWEETCSTPPRSDSEGHIE